MPVLVQSALGALEPITLPRAPDGSEPGRTLPARDFTGAMRKLAVAADAGEDGAAVELLRQCVPGITDDEIGALTDGEVLWIVAYCARRLEETERLLGNAGGAAGAGPTSSPSSPTTPTTTPSPATPARSAGTGGRSGRKPRSTASSTPATV